MANEKIMRPSVRIFCFVSFLLVSLQSPAASRIDDIRDDKLLNTALLEVSQMPREELDVLTEALSACAQLPPLDDGMSRFYCNKELIRYQLRGGAAPAVEQLLGSLYSTSRLLRLKGSEKRLPDFEGLIRREVEIYDMLLITASVRAMEVAKPRGGKRSSTRP